MAQIKGPTCMPMAALRVWIVTDRRTGREGILTVETEDEDEGQTSLICSEDSLLLISRFDLLAQEVARQNHDIRVLAYRYTGREVLAVHEVMQ